MSFCLELSQSIPLQKTKHPLWHIFLKNNYSNVVEGRDKLQSSTLSVLPRLLDRKASLAEDAKHQGFCKGDQLPWSTFPRGSLILPRTGHLIIKTADQNKAWRAWLPKPYGNAPATLMQWKGTYRFHPLPWDRFLNGAWKKSIWGGGRKETFYVALILIF